jgi:hypothetical protein
VNLRIGGQTHSKKAGKHCSQRTPQLKQRLVAVEPKD